MNAEHILERQTHRRPEARARDTALSPADGQLTLADEMLAGAAGGLAGGMMMTAVMTMGLQTGMIKKPLPVRVERWAEERAGLAERTGPAEEQVIGQGLHLLYSALAGAGYGALRRALNAPAIPSGPMYGLGLWALNLGAILPALNLTQGPLNEEPKEAGRRLMMHFAFGTVTALVSRKVRERMAA